MSSFVGLHTALTGIRAGQRGLDTASHNVANVNTPGYTRQRVELASRIPWQSEVGPVGTGVDVVGVRRLREAFLDTRVRSIGEQFAAADSVAAVLQRAEAVLGEPDNGVTILLGEVSDAFDDLALDPADPAARAGVVGALEALTGRFNAVARGWEQLAADTGQRLDAGVRDVNGALVRLDELNRAIGSFGGEDVPNDLLDERDLLLDELAGAVGATSTLSADDRVTVLLDGQTLVAPATPGVVTTLSIGNIDASADGSVEFAVSSSPTTPRAVGGELGALQQALTTHLPGIVADFDALAVQVATTLNDVHDDGFDAGGNPGGALLLGTSAADLALAPGFTAADLAAAAVTGAPHDGRNAQRIADLREGVLDTAARGFAVDLGQQVAEATRAADGQEALMTSATVARQSAHSVSLDEEMISLVQFQRAVEASARVMTAVDQALDVLVNRTGVVGR